MLCIAVSACGWLTIFAPQAKHLAAAHATLVRGTLRTKPTVRTVQQAGGVANIKPMIRCCWSMVRA